MRKLNYIRFVYELVSHKYDILQTPHTLNFLVLVTILTYVSYPFCKSNNNPLHSYPLD